MAFGLTIGTDRATALQNSIRDELGKRGYSNDDFVMAEYITIMIINNKAPDQISSELEDLIGGEYDRNFTEWLFAEAAKGAPDSQAQPLVPIPLRQPEPAPSEQSPMRDPPPHMGYKAPHIRPPHPGARQAPQYQPVISQTLPSGTKRPASARSPSPPSGHGPNKTRRTELPAGPRAMFNRDNGNNNSGRSLLDRVGPRGVGPSFEDAQQPRFDGMGPANFPNGMGSVDMNGMAAAAMGNPMMLQEMMMNQMALMAQMAGAMGMVNPAQFANGMNPGGPGFPDMAMMNGMNGMNGFPPQQPPPPPQLQMGGARGRPNGRGGVGGRGRGRGASNLINNRETNSGDISVEVANEVQPAPVVAAPQPTPAVSSSVPPTTTRVTYIPPGRPQSPTLCKFALKCTNASCRYSHPSPVATAESGVVLSNDHCEQGKDCKDKDCIKAHVSPAVLNPKALEQNRPTPTIPPQSHAHQPPSQTHVQCRYGLSCTRIHSGCPYSHPSPKSAAPCRFGAACTRANCTFQHPEGRVLPTSFHRGLGADAPNVSLVTPPAGSIGAPSPHRSVTFNKDKDELERKVKEIEETKAKLNEAQAAAAAKKDDGSKPVAIAA